MSPNEYMTSSETVTQVLTDVTKSTCTQPVEVTHNVTVIKSPMSTGSSTIITQVENNLPSTNELPIEFICNDDLVDLSEQDETINGLPERITTALSILPHYRSFFQDHFPQHTTHISPQTIENRIHDRVVQLHSCFDRESRMIAAQREAAGYDFPPEVATRDAALIEELGSVRAVVKYYHDLSKDSRLNEHSV